MDSEATSMAQAVAERGNQQIASLGHSYILNSTLVVGGSLLMAACAHVSIPLWFTPVPITLQTFGVVFLALTLGGWRAAAALVLYLLEGISGLPVFSPHGPGGPAHVLGPTGGYLLCYPIAALVCGFLAEKLSRRSPMMGFAAAALIAESLILAAGSLWLLALTHRSPSAVFAAAVLPFIPGEILKAAAAAGAARGVRHMQNHLR
jgi:biotin transport system substrate-specific component